MVMLDLVAVCQSRTRSSSLLEKGCRILPDARDEAGVTGEKKENERQSGKVSTLGKNSLTRFFELDSISPSC